MPVSGLPPATESEIKTREKQFFAAYYASLDRAEHLGDGSLFAYFAAELARAERLYGHSFQHPASVLSVGAGWGTISVWAGWQYPQWRIVSMDYVEDSLPYHHEIARLSQTEWRGHLAVEDWDALPHARHTFDYVLADRALHHAIDPVRALKELHRVTKPGGCFVMLREPSLPLARQQAGTAFATHALEQGANDHIYTVPEWIRFFETAGWQVQARVHLEDVTRILHSPRQPLLRRAGKWLYHRASPDWLERLLYPYTIRYGSGTTLAKLTYYARA